MFMKRTSPSSSSLALTDGSFGGRYKSRKSSDFASWDLWEPSLRLEVLKITRRPFCAYGYDRLLREHLGAEFPREMGGFCEGLSLTLMEEEEPW